MKVLMIADNLKGGGTERRLIECIKGIKQAKFEVELISLNTQVAYPDVEHLGITIHLIRRRIKKDPFIIPDLFRICRRFKPDIMHCWGTMAAVYAVPVRLFLGIPFVNGMITNATCPKYSWRWWRARITFPFSDIILSNSLAGLKAYHAPEKKSKCIYNGFNFERLNHLPSRISILDKFQITSQYIVGMVGMIDYRKDFGVFIKAARILSQQMQGITFLCIGDGLLYEEMKNLAADLPQVKFTGRQTEIESIISVLDIGVLLTNTRRHYEGISNTILEYMAAGIPVIATDGGGTNEIVVNHDTGFLIAPGSADALAEKIKLLLQNRDLGRKMGESGKKRIHLYFSFEKMISSLIEVYRKFT